MVDVAAEVAEGEGSAQGVASAGSVGVEPAPPTKSPGATLEEALAGGDESFCLATTGVEASAVCEEDIAVALATVTLIGSAPVLVVALGVGLAIAFFQALTQIQEMTLTFVPKIAAIFVTLAISIPFIFSTLVGLSDRVFDLVSNGGL